MNPVFAALKRVLPQWCIDVIRWVRQRKRNVARGIPILYRDFRQWYAHADKKPISEQVAEIRYLWSTFGQFPHEYFLSHHYRKGVDGKKLVPKKELLQTRAELNDPDRSLLDDKSAFRAVAEKSGVKIVKELFCVQNDGKIIGPDMSVLTKDMALNAISVLNGKVFIKPLDGMMGTDAYSCDDKTDFSFLFERGNWIVQPIIQQHEVLQNLYPHSINTLRIDTFIEGGKVQICRGFLRLGMNGMFVDNVSAGGLYAPIDTKTGLLTGPASQMDEFDSMRTKYQTHPNTGVAFEGLQLPDTKAVHKNLILVAASMPQYTCVGWDVAFTTDGPVIVEGNYRSDVEIFQEHWPMGYHPLGQATYKRMGLPY